MLGRTFKNMQSMGERQGTETLQHRIGFRTQIGRTHHVNQDAGGAWSFTRPDGTAASLLIVADGVSAGRHSEVASRLAVELIQQRLVPLLQGDTSLESVAAELHSAAQAANHEVARRPHDSPYTADATTLAALACIGVDVTGVWCGDSRAYRIGSSVARITRDHSWAEGVVSHGLMTAEQAARDPRAHMITRWLGPPDQDDPGLERFDAQLRPGDTVMCCSDGLYMYFNAPYGTENEIGEAFAAGDAEAALDGLVATAFERGGHDDVTVAVLQVLSR